MKPTQLVDTVNVEATETAPHHLAGIVYAMHRNVANKMEQNGWGKITTKPVSTDDQVNEAEEVAILAETKKPSKVK